MGGGGVLNRLLGGFVRVVGEIKMIEVGMEILKYKKKLKNLNLYFSRIRRKSQKKQTTLARGAVQEGCDSAGHQTG